MPEPAAAIAAQQNSPPAQPTGVKTNQSTASAAPTLSSPMPVQNPAAANTAATVPLASIAGNSPATGKSSLFEQRLAAGKQLLDQKKAIASIQLFYNEEIQTARIEGFLQRADKLGKLPEIYLLPAKFGGKKGLRVLYGAYPSVDTARNAVKDLPARYQEAFTPSIYMF
jgi:septal ring-binding cell division protein DamX